MFCILLAVLPLFCRLCAAKVPTLEVEALRHLYEATGGEEWSYSTGVGSEWDFSLPDNITDPCYNEWNGLKCTLPAVDCNVSSCSITEVSLIDFDMRGTIPASVSQLTALRRISLFENYLTGTIPAAFSSLTDLYYLNFGKNRLTGTLSPTLSALTQMNLLDVSFNYISGSIPDAYSVYTNFGTVQLQYNLFSGSIPSSITNQTRLSFFEVQYNDLWGEVPIFGSGIRTIQLSHNLLSQALPHGSINRQKLTNLYVDHNFLTGVLPEFDQVYKRMYYVHFENNFFSGTLPQSFALITGTKHLSVARNVMTGTVPLIIPESLRLMHILDVSNNRFSGSLPTTLFLSTALQYIYFHKNRFSGSLPIYGTEAIALEQLYVFDNDLTGTLPLALAALPALQSLLLQYNRFHGHLVGEAAIEGAEITLFPSLQVLDISANRFSGSVPTRMFNLSSVLHIAILQNCFSGTLPTALCDFQSLEGLLLEGLRSGRQCRDDVWDPVGLTNTYFTEGIEGSIPECIFTMSNLRTLHITGNRLSGTIPSNMSMPYLTDLRLSYNHLSGTIPNELLQNPPEKLDLSHNRFSGEYALHITAVTPNTSSLKLNSNRFSGNIARAFKHIPDIDVLSGNLFACQSRSSLPSRDPESNTYTCGSNAFDIPLIIWAVCVLTIVGLAIVSVFVMKSWSMDFAVLERCRKLILQQTKLYRAWIDSISNTITQMKNYEEIRRFAATLKHLRFVTLCVTVFIIVCFGLIYYCSKVAGDYGTHVYQYRWIFTAAYLSGMLPAILMLVAVLLLLGAIIHYFYRSHSLIGQERSVTSRRSASHAKSGNTRFAASDLESYFFVVAVVFADVVCVVLVKGVYVYLLLWEDISYNSQTALNVALSLFDILWNAVVVTKAVSLFPSLIRSKSRIRMHLFLLLFNSIVAPMIAAASTDRNCFVEIFVGIDEVTSVSEYELCVLVYEDGCLSKEITTVSTSYVPPFSYNYQCMSSILTNFVPVFMYSYIILGFVVPLVIFLSLRLLPHSATLLHCIGGVMPRIFFPGRIISQDYNPHKLFRPGIIISSVLHHLTVLLTFGVAAPLLALCIGCAISTTTLMWELLLGRYVYNILNGSDADELSQSSNVLHGDRISDSEFSCAIGKKVQRLRQLNEVDTICHDVWQGPLKALWVIVDYTLLFFVCLTMDVVGDRYGWMSNVYFVIIPAFVVVVLLRLCYGTSIWRNLMSRSTNVKTDEVLMTTLHRSRTSI